MNRRMFYNDFIINSKKGAIPTIHTVNEIELYLTDKNEMLNHSTSIQLLKHRLEVQHGNIIIYLSLEVVSYRWVDFANKQEAISPMPALKRCYISHGQ